jgi:hypothetical protein
MLGGGSRDCYSEENVYSVGVVVLVKFSLNKCGKKGFYVF